MNEYKNNRTDFLFKKRNFFTGAASVFNISAANKDFNTSATGEEADYKALKSDWEMIGEDFKKSVKKLISK